MNLDTEVKKILDAVKAQTGPLQAELDRLSDAFLNDTPTHNLALIALAKRRVGKVRTLVEQLEISGPVLSAMAQELHVLEARSLSDEAVVMVEVLKELDAARQLHFSL